MYVKSLMTPGQESGGILPANHLRVFKISDGDALAQLFLAIENFGEETGDLYFLKITIQYTEAVNFMIRNVLNKLQFYSCQSIFIS